MSYVAASQKLRRSGVGRLHLVPRKGRDGRVAGHRVRKAGLGLSYRGWGDGMHAEVAFGPPFDSVLPIRVIPPTVSSTRNHL